MYKKYLLLLLALNLRLILFSQDTFSILAFDSLTHEVGAAGASCVDLFQATGYSNDFICELFPDSGAIACQASYHAFNQAGARIRMRSGDSPSQLINWLSNNDINLNPSIRQYGVVELSNGSPRTAAFTGSNCMNYKNHIVGPNYTIHGNILLGQKVLDSMEAGFKRAKGDLACKLMGAIKGAKMVGADSRCAPYNTSSLFAFLKVMQPTDTFGKPSLLLSLKTHSNSSIEPIDSLEKMFNNTKVCLENSVNIPSRRSNLQSFSLVPNPSSDILRITAPGSHDVSHCRVYDLYGNEILKFEMGRLYNLNVSEWQKGIYIVEWVNGEGIINKKLVVN